MSLVTNEAGESMGQFPFRVSHAITVRKWLDVGRLKVFFTYRSGAGARKIQAAGASRAFLFSPSLRDCPMGSLQTPQRLSKCCLGPHAAPLPLHSTHQGSHKGPPKLQEEGRGFHLLMGGGPERSYTLKALQDPPRCWPIELVLTQEKMLTGTHGTQHVHCRNPRSATLPAHLGSRLLSHHICSQIHPC